MEDGGKSEGVKTMCREITSRVTSPCWWFHGTSPLLPLSTSIMLDAKQRGTEYFFFSRSKARPGIEPADFRTGSRRLSIRPPVQYVHEETPFIQHLATKCSVCHDILKIQCMKAQYKAVIYVMIKSDAAIISRPRCQQVQEPNITAMGIQT